MEKNTKPLGNSEQPHKSGHPVFSPPKNKKSKEISKRFSKISDTPTTPDTSDTSDTQTQRTLDHYRIKCNRYIYRSLACLKPGVVVHRHTPTPEGNKYSAHRVPCKTLLCERCSKRRRAKIASEIRYFIIGNKETYLLTLTLKFGTHKTGKIMEYWKRLRARLWKQGERFKFFLVREFTKKGTEHLHILIDRPINRAVLGRYWKAITGDSFILDIRKADGGAIAYLSKYLAKNSTHWRKIIIHRLRMYAKSKGMMLGQHTILRVGSLYKICDTFQEALRVADEMSRELFANLAATTKPIEGLHDPPPF